MATSEDVQKVWVMLIAAYPYYAKEQQPEQLRLTLKLYQRMLADVDMQVLQAATLQHIASNKFFPAIAELRGMCGTVAVPQLPTAMEGWGEVIDALADVRYYRYADGFHALPQFSPITQKVVDAMGFHTLSASEDGTADRARFLQAYEVMARRMADNQALLPEVRAVQARIAAAETPQLAIESQEAWQP